MADNDTKPEAEDTEAPAEKKEAAAETDAEAPAPAEEESNVDKAAATLASLMPGGAVAEEEAAPAEPEIDAHGRSYATGKRKDAVARVWIKPGNGKIVVNGRDVEVYFARPTSRMVINQPFEAANRKDQYDVICTVRGGGLSGQAGAVRHGISKASGCLRTRPAPGPETGRLPDPRPARGRAQEVRPPQGPPQLPVLQALGPVPLISAARGGPVLRICLIRAACGVKPACRCARTLEHRRRRLSWHSARMRQTSGGGNYGDRT